MQLNVIKRYDSLLLGGTGHDRIAGFPSSGTRESAENYQV